MFALDASLEELNKLLHGMLQISSLEPTPRPELAVLGFLLSMRYRKVAEFGALFLLFQLKRRYSIPVVFQCQQV